MLDDEKNRDPDYVERKVKPSLSSKNISNVFSEEKFRVGRKFCISEEICCFAWCYLPKECFEDWIFEALERTKGSLTARKCRLSSKVSVSNIQKIIAIFRALEIESWNWSCSFDGKSSFLGIKPVPEFPQTPLIELSVIESMACSVENFLKLPRLSCKLKGTSDSLASQANSNELISVKMIKFANANSCSGLKKGYVSKKVDHEQTSSDVSNSNEPLQVAKPIRSHNEFRMMKCDTSKQEPEYSNQKQRKRISIKEAIPSLSSSFKPIQKVTNSLSFIENKNDILKSISTLVASFDLSSIDTIELLSEISSLFMKKIKSKNLIE